MRGGELITIYIMYELLFGRFNPRQIPNFCKNKRGTNVWLTSMRSWIRVCFLTEWSHPPSFAPKSRAGTSFHFGTVHPFIATQFPLNCVVNDTATWWRVLGVDAEAIFDENFAQKEVLRFKTSCSTHSHPFIADSSYLTNRSGLVRAATVQRPVAPTNVGVDQIRFKTERWDISNAKQLAQRISCGMSDIRWQEG